MSSNDRKRSKNKKWFMKNAKKPRRAFSLGPEQKGFLLSCNFREREAIREAYQLLNEYADQMYGPEIAAVLAGGDVAEDEEDIDACLEAETEALKAQTEKKEEERRFQVVETSVKNFLFVRTTVKSPVELVTKILEDVVQTGVQRVRHLLRIVPIEQTCKAFEKPMAETLKNILTPHFDKKTDSTSYVVIFKTHCHNTITKDAVVCQVGTLVKEMNPNAIVDYKNADLSIIVDIIKDTACCSVVPKFFHYKKYNLGELANASKQRATGNNDSAESEAPPDSNLTSDVKNQPAEDCKTVSDENRVKDSSAENQEGAETCTLPKSEES